MSAVSGVAVDRIPQRVRRKLDAMKTEIAADNARDAASRRNVCYSIAEFAFGPGEWLRCRRTILAELLGLGYGYHCNYTPSGLNPSSMMFARPSPAATRDSA
jgi:hypothetical protein